MDLSPDANTDPRNIYTQMPDSQIDFICLECPLKECDQQSLWCKFRLQTNPNWMQKRKIADDKKKLEKRASESGRTKYWREYARKKRVNQIIERPLVKMEIVDDPLVERAEV